jgi:hypothetical protein
MEHFARDNSPENQVEVLLDVLVAARVGLEVDALDVVADDLVDLLGEDAAPLLSCRAEEIHEGTGDCVAR